MVREHATFRVVGVVALAVAASAWTVTAGSLGSKIVFEGDRAGVWGLSVMNADGSGIVDLPGLPGADAAWSPNGQRIAFEADPNGDGNLEVFVADADGSNVRQLTDAPGADFWPDWFPDGHHLAFTSFRSGIPNIHVVNVDSLEVTALTDDGVFGSFQPDVSPNGREVVFMRSPQFEPPTIWKVDVGSLILTPLTLPGPHEDTDAQWSPNGKRIVFSSNRGGTYEIWSMDQNGDGVAQLTAAPGRDGNPTFSPDGQQIAWWKFRGGQGDIWVMNSDGSGAVNITNTPGVTEGFPDWHQGHLRR